MGASPEHTGRLGRLCRVPPRWWMHGVAATATCVLAVVICTTGDSPRAGLERWCSDHYSHTGATVLFLDQGLDVYRRPVQHHCRPARRGDDWRHRRALARRLDVNPVDLCVRSRKPGARVLVINWQKFPRPYPPGLMLYFLPEALLWEHTHASFQTVNRFTVVKLLVTGHLAWLVLAWLLAGFRPRGVAWVVLALGYSQLAYWSAVGIYDGVSILFLLLTLLALQRARGSLALLALAAAGFFHFRALWYLPLALPALACVVLRRELRANLGVRLTPGGQRWRLPNGVPLALALLLWAATAYVFWTLWPALTTFPVKNPVFHKAFAWHSPVFTSLLVVTAGVLALLAFRRSWLAAGLVLWTTVFMLRTPQIMSWHALHLLPLLAVPALAPSATDAPATPRRAVHLEQTVALLFWVLMAMAVVFRTSPWPGWIGSVLRRLGAGA